MKKLILLSFLSAFLFTQAQAQIQQLPAVFLLGENEDSYEVATQTYSKTLLEVCSNDMKGAFDHWINMMKDMESFAERIKFDVKGVKVWMHVFWNEQGSIDHIGYFLRPDSRNIKTNELSAFFKAFMNQYETFPLKSDRKFSHYTGATFPTFVERAKPSN